MWSSAGIKRQDENSLYPGGKKIWEMQPIQKRVVNLYWLDREVPKGNGINIFISHTISAGRKVNGGKWQVDLEMNKTPDSRSFKWWKKYNPLICISTDEE